MTLAGDSQHTPNCNSIRPVVFAQGSGDLASRHVCELSIRAQSMVVTDRHDDEKRAAQLKLHSAKMNRPQGRIVVRLVVRLVGRCARRDVNRHCQQML